MLGRIKRFGSAPEFTAKVALRVAVSLYSYKYVRTFVTKVTGKRVPDKWIFILGCYNSGTTILRTLLAGHPDIRVLPREGVRLTGELRRPEDLGWTRMWIGCPDYMTEPKGGRSTSDRIIRDWSPWWKRGGSVFVEKSISNVTRIDWLAENFPGACFLAITRDGYSVAEGIHRRARPKKSAAKKLPNGYPIEWAARQWVDANQRIIEAESRLDNFRRISYESLIEDPRSVLLDIFEFLKLPPPLLENFPDGVIIGDRKIALFNGNEKSHASLTDEQITRVSKEIDGLQRALGYEIKQTQ